MENTEQKVLREVKGISKSFNPFKKAQKRPPFVTWREFDDFKNGVNRRLDNIYNWIIRPKG